VPVYFTFEIVEASMVINYQTSEHRMPMEWSGIRVSVSALIRQHLLSLEVGQSAEITSITDRLGFPVSLDYIRVALHRWKRNRRFTIRKTENGMMVTRVEIKP
jgi:hypothetical protein